MTPNAEYVLDWFHITMRFTVLTNTMNGLRHDADPEPEDTVDEQRGDNGGVEQVEVLADMPDLLDELQRDLSRAKWHLWHGTHHRAEQLLEDIACGLYGCVDNDARTKTARFLEDLRGYLRRNRAMIPNYSERHVAGEPISSATAEATVNQVIAKRMVKKQQMRWSPTGAHRILQIRTRVLDDQLQHDITRWHPQPAALPATPAAA